MIHSIYFETADCEDDRFDQMAEVYRQSLAKNCTLPAYVRKIEQCHMSARDAMCNANHYKLQRWADMAGGWPCILTDADMICLRDPSPLFDQVEHIGITLRDQEGGIPAIFNGGFVVINSAIGFEVMSKWYEADCQLYHNPELHEQYRSKWAGMNQASFGYMLDKEPEIDELITRLDCSEWNNVEPWTGWRDAAFVHIKGQMQRAIFDDQDSLTDEQVDLRDYWESLNTQDNQRSEERVESDSSAG